MPGINEIRMEDIERLTALQLSQLLLKLLQLEARRNALPTPDISVPFNITTGDAGEDGHIRWSGGLELTPWLPNRYSFFQNKATDLFPGKCGEEILAAQSANDQKERKPRVLKRQVQDVVDAGGTYILFTTRAIVEDGKRARIEGFREGVALTGHPDPESVDFRVYDANDIARWVNEHIATVTLVQGFLGISRPAGFVTWQEWSKQPSVTETHYHVYPKLQEFMELIADFSESPKKMRICGHSGLGKSRLVFEAFRDNAHQSSIVYYDLEGAQDVQLLKNYIISHRDHHAGAIIVDNCPADAHRILSAQIYGDSKIGIITIGFDHSDGNDDPLIKLFREDQFEIVEQIIADKLPSHQAQDRLYLKEICEGYPWMANRFCNNIQKKGFKDFNTIIPQEFMKRLLFDAEEHPGHYDVVRACSVFSSFGFPDDQFTAVVSGTQLAELKEQVVYIWKNIFTGNLTYHQFFAVCQKYKREDILERRGLFYSVKPTVLAITLAADWFMDTDHSKIGTVLIDLKGKELATKMAERFADLDQLSKAAILVADLVGANGFFGSAEVLTSSWGSLLFRHLVEVNPVATVDALYAAIGTWNVDQIKNIREGRRNLVWSLEKLCFRSESFLKAARLLLLLAAGENERWSNNATNQFFQLFHIFLSGTQAPYNDRLMILQWGLSKNDESFTRLVIQAIGKAWKFRNAYRMGGAEKQGSGPPMKDYMPASQLEIAAYIRDTIAQLRPFALSDDEIGKLARFQITAATRELISAGTAVTDLVTTLISDVHQTIGGVWKEAYDELAKSLQFEVHDEDSEAKIKRVMQELMPTDVKTQLLFSVIKPQWQPFEQKADGIYVDRAKAQAEAYAERVIADDTDLRPYLVDLLTGEQVQTFAFAAKLGADQLQRDRLLPLTLTQLRTLPADTQNPSFLAGLIKGATDDTLFDTTIDEMITDPSLAGLAFYVTQSYTITLASLTRLFALVDRGVQSITRFSVFQYGSVLDVLTDEELMTLTTKIQSYGPDGKWTALCLLFMNAFKDTRRWTAITENVKTLILSDNLILMNPSPRVMEAYYWGSTVMQLLSTGADIPFAKQISQQIVDYCSVPEINYNYDVEVLKVVQALFDIYFDAVWDIFGECLLSPFPAYYNMTNLLQTRDLQNAKAAWLFEDRSRWDKLYNWVDRHKEMAAKRIAALMPLGEQKEGQVIWHSFSRAFIERFGDQPGVLEAVSASMGTFSLSGSATGYYKTQRELLLELSNSASLQVRDWVAGMLEYTDREIKRSQIEDEGGPMSPRIR